MPLPYLLFQDRAVAPVVLTCEHASPELPTGVPGTAATRALLRTHHGHDLGAWSFACALAAQLGASAIGGRWSRLWIDLNRRVGDPSLIRTAVGDTRLPWNANLTPEQVEHRILTHHAPYHAAVDHLILRQLVRDVRPIVFAVHSFTPVLDGQPRDFDVGVLYERHEVEARHLGEHVRRAGFAVRYNEPYSGMEGMMYAVDRHGSHHRLPCLELEVVDTLLAEPPRAAALAAAVAAALCELTRSAR